MNHRNQLTLGSWRKVVWLGLGGAVSAAWAQVPTQQGSAQPIAATNYDQVRTAALRAKDRVSKAKAEKEKVCHQADQADDDLLAKGETAGVQSQLLAGSAMVWRQQCDKAEKELEDAQTAQREARAQLRRTAGASDPVPSKADIDKFIEDAAKVQEQAEDLRKSLATAFDQVDVNTQAALKLTLPKDYVFLDPAADLQRTTVDMRKKRSEAQEAANVVVAAALELKNCALAQRDECAQVQVKEFARGMAAKGRFSAHADSINRFVKDLKTSTEELVITQAWPDSTERLNALAFNALLKSYPDANSAFSKTPFHFLASNKGSKVTVQLGLDKVFGGGWQNFTLKLSTPLGSGATSGELIGSSDGLGDGRRVALAWEGQSMRGRLWGTDNWLTLTSLEAGFENKKLSYYPDGPTAFTTGNASTSVTPWDLGLATAIHDSKGRNVYVLSVRRKAVHELGSAETRCPTDGGDFAFVKCINGPFGPPKSSRSTEMGFQIRARPKDSPFAFSPSLSYDSRSRVRSVGLPIYFIHSADDEKHTVSGGVRIDWLSKGKPEITGRTENTLTWGVFVGAPFKLFGLPD